MSSVSSLSDNNALLSEEPPFAATIPPVAAFFWCITLQREKPFLGGLNLVVATLGIASLSPTYEGCRSGLPDGVSAVGTAFLPLIAL